MKPKAWLFERTNPADNISRFYYIAWQRTLLDPEGAGSVLRIYGRKGGHQRVLPSVSFDDGEEAAQYIQQLIQKREQRGYTLVNPDQNLRKSAISASQEMQ